MNVTTLLTMAVLVGWLGPMMAQSETTMSAWRISPSRFRPRHSAAAAGALARESPTGEFGLTLSGTLFSWAARRFAGHGQPAAVGTLHHNRRRRQRPMGRWHRRCRQAIRVVHLAMTGTALVARARLPVIDGPESRSQTTRF